MIKRLPAARNVSLKYSLRLHLIPHFARIAHFLGMGWKAIGSKMGRETMLAQIRSIHTKEKMQSVHRKGLEVIFLTMIGGHTHNVSVELVLALALKKRGHNIKFVICDQCLPLCEVKRFEIEEKWDKACGKCYAFGKKYIMASGFQIIPSSQLADSDYHVDLNKYEHLVEASLLKHYKVGELDETLPHLSNRRKMIKESIIKSARIGKKLIELEPDRVIMSHGIYSTWGPQRDLLNTAGIPVVTYGKGKKKGTQKFNWAHSSDWWDVSDVWKLVKDESLTEDQVKRVDEYLYGRVHQAKDNFVLNFGEVESREAILKRFELDPKKLTYSLFTNVLWDASSAQREIVFKNPIDWVVKTIKWFKNHSNKQLILKIHPAELVIGTNQSFYDIINRYFHEMPNNVRIISPSEKVNSWSIFGATDLGIVHTTTVGMELPLEGIPCIVVSETHFRNKGFTLDIESEEDYFRYLEHFDPSKIERRQMKVLAKRYAYLLFERYQIPFPYLNEYSYGDIRSFNFNSAEELQNSYYINYIVGAIENKTSFVPEPEYV